MAPIFQGLHRQGDNCADVCCFGFWLLWLCTCVFAIFVSCILTIKALCLLMYLVYHNKTVQTSTGGTWITKDTVGLVIYPRGGGCGRRRLRCRWLGAQHLLWLFGRGRGRRGGGRRGRGRLRGNLRSGQGDTSCVVLRGGVLLGGFASWS